MAAATTTSSTIVKEVRQTTGARHFAKFLQAPGNALDGSFRDNGRFIFVLGRANGKNVRATVIIFGTTTIIVVVRRIARIVMVVMGSFQVHEIHALIHLQAAAASREIIGVVVIVTGGRASGGGVVLFGTAITEGAHGRNGLNTESMDQCGMLGSVGFRHGKERRRKM